MPDWAIVAGFSLGCEGFLLAIWLSYDCRGGEHCSHKFPAVERPELRRTAEKIQNQNETQRRR